MNLLESMRDIPLDEEPEGLGVNPCRIGPILYPVGENEIHCVLSESGVGQISTRLMEDGLCHARFDAPAAMPRDDLMKSPEYARLSSHKRPVPLERSVAEISVDARLENVKLRLTQRG